MLTESHVAGYRTTIEDLVTVALKDVKRVLHELEANSSPIECRDTLIAFLPRTLEPYAAAASVVAAEWYTQLRDLAGTSVSFTTTPLLADLRSEAESLARYAASSFFGKSRFPAERLASGGVQRLIAHHGRVTVHANMIRDPAPTRWARVAAPGCCAFCLMLAGRGAIYRSRESATGRATTGHPLGSVRQFMRGFHNNCSCIAVPLHDGQQISIPRDPTP